MTRSPPHARAEACFAVARSATFAGERDNAISRGTAIAEAAGLSLDLFDIPGRSRPHFGSAERICAAMDASDLAGAIERFRRAFEQAATELGVFTNETIYAAQRRNFDRACADAAARDRASGAGR